MRTMPAWLVLLCRAIIVVLLPVALTLTNVRLLLTHAYPDIEYSLPGFPADPYGFTKTDRLMWSKLSIDYLLNGSGIEFLRNLHFSPGITAPAESCQYYLDGDCNRFYNDRELKHMSDVKIIIGYTLNLWAISGILSLLAAGALYFFREKAALRAALLGGTGVTLVILVGIVVFLTLNFDTFFVQFHELLFAGGTWTFLYSDSLIRLFPERFWQDAFTVVGGGAVIEALLIGAWAWWGLK
jgi:integral membrane protein (TIGR01906 family)